jgi:hypothetical protein
MAHDNQTPNIAFILKVAFLAITGFVVTRVGLVAYFDSVADEETYEKVGKLKNPLLTEVRSWEKAQLSSGPMPIDKSMNTIAEKGRMAMPQIEPKQSTDTAPLECWKMMPCTPPAAMLVDAAAPTEAAPAAAGDAGVAAAAGDAAAPATADGGGAHP